MRKLFLIKITFFVSFLVLSISGATQNSFLNGWNIGAKLGGSRMIGEFPNNFSEVITEFDYKTGLAIDGELSKIVGNHLEIGFDVNHSTLKGENLNLNPLFTAQGHHSAFKEPFTAPVKFDNKLFGQKFFFRYYFKNILDEKDGFKINPFIRIGVGYLKYNSKFKYIDAPETDLIFGKGHNGYTQLTTAVYTLGTGFKSMLSPKVYLLACLDFKAVNYDFLDVVHNYHDGGDRLELLGIYTDFKIGIFYNLSPVSIKKSKGKRKGKGKTIKSGESQYLPFAR